MSLALTQLRAMIARDPGAVSVAFGSITTKGLLSYASEDIISGADLLAIRGETPMLEVPLADLPGVKTRSVLTVDGASYRVKHPEKADDGLLGRFYLEEA